MRRQHSWTIFLDCLLSLHNRSFFGCKEAVVNAQRQEILVPFYPDFLTHQITLVDDQHKSAFSHLTSIGKQIVTIEEERVATINDLSQYVYSLHYTPQLSPNFDVFLVGSDLIIFRTLFNFSEFTSPVEIGFILQLLKLVLRLSLLPLGSPWNLQASKYSIKIDILCMFFTLILIENDLFADQLLPNFLELDVTVGMEILLTHLCDL